MKKISFSSKCGLLIVIIMVLFVLLMVQGPIVTPMRYLTLADNRQWLSIPNAWNVLSNIPFLIVGVWGLSVLFKPNVIVFRQPREKIFYVLFFFGVFLAGLGSMYYHWTPDYFHLMWDRFAITVAMTGFFCAIIAERISINFSRFILWPLLILSFFSVYYWYYSTTQNNEDIRIYVFFSVSLPALLIPIMLLLFKTNYTQSQYIWIAFIFFIIGRICEGYDLAIYKLFKYWLSGHTLKHLWMALSCLLILYYLKKRKIQHSKYEL